MTEVEAKASRPRTVVFKVKVKAKARPLQGQGHDLLSSSCPWGRRQSSRTTSLHNDSLKLRPLIGLLTLVQLLAVNPTDNIVNIPKRQRTNNTHMYPTD